MQRQDRAAAAGQQQSADRNGQAAGDGGQEGGNKGRLGPFLCWAIVFADLGTSVYYTPGILFQQPGVGPHAALFVGLTLIVFVLLARKYGEVAVRYPEGGGVVTVTANAIHPFAGVLGGMFILVDYFLTAALSALSGIIYLSDVFPVLHPVAVYLPVTIAAIVLLGLLNLVGVSESARVNAAFAVAAAASQLAVVLAVIVRRGTSDPLNRSPQLFEIVNPYLDDPEAQGAFAQAERLARRRHLNHRYLYLPSTAGPDAVAGFWETLRPEETLVVAGEEDILAGITAARVYASDEGGVSVLHYQTRATDRAS